MARSHRRGPVLKTVTSAALVASIAMGAGAGLAQAAPEQGGTNPNDTAPQQLGTSPESDAPQVLQQGGTTPTPEPAAPVEPVYTPGPGTLPAPPQEAPYQPYVEPTTHDNTGPSYQTDYDPVPEKPLTAPKPTAPVRPIAPPPEKIRVGNFITDIPQGMAKRDVTSINEWAAYGEAKIAQNLIAVGVPKDEASRRAASTIIGVALGGTTGAAIGSTAAVPGAMAGALVGVPVGAIVGAIYNGVVFAQVNVVPGGGQVAYANLIGLGALAGAGIGLAAGTAIGAAAAGAAGAATGAVIGGTIGGATAYALGAGDPGARPTEPWKQGDTTTPGVRQAPEAAPVANPQANQFEVHLPAEKAAQAGLPKADYVVNQRGDVNVQVGTAKISWSAEQAAAPYQAMGASGPAQKANAAKYTKQNAPQIKQILPGVTISWPQEIAPAAG
ncbi:hypothetical protein ACWDTI_03635 [Gordonia sp. NPDC003424]